MKQRTNHPGLRCGMVPLVCLLLATGCSGQKNPAPATQAKNSSAAAAAGAKVSGAAEAPPQVPRSVFTVSDSLRDPFFPKAKKRVAASASVQDTAPLDLNSLLKAEFIGVSGFGEVRIAVFRNALLERGQAATLQLGAAGQARPVTVRCREVLRNGVVLEVQGQSQPITISVAERP